MKAENGLKKCSKCGEVKEVKEFGMHKARADGLCNYCKECKSDIDKEYRHSIPEKHRENNRVWWRLSKQRILYTQNEIRERLGDRYVQTKLSQNFGIKFKEVSSQMIEIKRLQLTNKRFIKKLKLCKTSKI